jgi:hypothetical protein
VGCRHYRNGTDELPDDESPDDVLCDGVQPGDDTDDDQNQVMIQHCLIHFVGHCEQSGTGEQHRAFREHGEHPDEQCFGQLNSVVHAPDV